jgi:preprotein translocase subunit SecY
LVSIVLLASTVVVMEAVRPIIAQPTGARSENSGRVVFTYRPLQGGFVVPVVMAATVVALPFGISTALGVQTTPGIDIWSLIGPVNWAGIGYHVALVVLIVGACLFTMRGAVDEGALATRLRRKRLVIRGVAPGKATVAYLRRLNIRLTIGGALWLALVVDIVPLVFQIALGSSRPHLQVGGGPFVIAAAIFIRAATLARRQIRA